MLSVHTQVALSKQFGGCKLLDVVYMCDRLIYVCVCVCVCVCMCLNRVLSDSVLLRREVR